MTTAPSSPELEPGQVWSFKSAKPTTAKVVIGKLDDLHGVPIVHVSIIDIPRAAGQPGDAETTYIGHAPFDRTALVSSLDSCVGHAHTLDDDFSDSIEQWRAAGGGVWTIGVSDLIRTIL